LRPGHPGLGQAVHRTLEFLAMLEIGGDAEIFEEVAEQRRLAAQTGETDFSQRLQPDRVTGGRKVIRSGTGPTLAKAVGKGDNEFALGTERGDGVAHLLDLGESHRVVTELDKQT